MSIFQYILQDYAANRGNTKGKIITVMFRLAALVSRRKWVKILFLPYLAFYRLFVEWILGIELPWPTIVGKELRIFHGQAIVVGKAVVIGNNCTLRQSTTIGNTKEGSGSPVIGNNVDIGSNVCILGAITIGDNVTIGAGSVVVKSIPSHSVAVGNPAKVIKTLEQPLL
jgi:putative colanic acid biosynthesis acetyltransferase WcaB